MYAVVQTIAWHKSKAQILSPAPVCGWKASWRVRFITWGILLEYQPQLSMVMSRKSEASSGPSYNPLELLITFYNECSETGVEMRRKLEVGGFSVF